MWSKKLYGGPTTKNMGIYIETPIWGQFVKF
jgi:hypothetical protein